MEAYNVIILIFGILLLLSLIVVFFVNKILQHKAKIDNFFLAIEEVLNERIKIIDDILNFLNNNLEHEKSYQKKLEQNKKLINTIKNNKEGIQLIKKTEKDIYNFLKLENTYKNLTKNKDYTKLKDKIENNKEKLIYASDIYDKGVIDYNNYRSNKLINILSKFLRIPDYDCYNK